VLEIGCVFEFHEWAQELDGVVEGKKLGLFSINKTNATVITRIFGPYADEGQLLIFFSEDRKRARGFLQISKAYKISGPVFIALEDKLSPELALSLWVGRLAMGSRKLETLVKKKHSASDIMTAAAQAKPKMFTKINV